MSPQFVALIALAVIVLLIVWKIAMRFFQKVRQRLVDNKPGPLVTVRSGAVARERGVRKPMNARALTEKALTMLEREARPRPDAGRDMPDALVIELNADQYSAVGRYISEIENLIMRGARDRALDNGWPEHPLRVAIRLNEYQQRYVRMAVNFEAPGFLTGGGTKRVAPMDVEEPEVEVPAEATTPVVTSPWALRLGDGRTVNLLEGRWYHIGADETNDLVVDDPYVSGTHVGLLAGPHGLQVEDGNGNRRSTNGTTVDGTAVTACVIPTGRDSTIVRLGPHVEVTVEYANALERRPV